MARQSQPPLSAPWPCPFQQISRHTQRQLGRALHLLQIRPLLGCGHDSTFPPRASPAGATTPLERARPSIHHTNPPRARGTPNTPSTVRPAWPRLSRDHFCGCAVRPGSADGGRWRRRTTVCRPSTRSSLAGSASPPGRAIPRSSRGMRAPRERRGSVADVGVARGGGFCMSAVRVYGPDRL